MSAGSRISAPLRFEGYTDEFLFHHPDMHVTHLQPLRVHVATRDGVEDDAVAMARLERYHTYLAGRCAHLYSAHEQRMHAAVLARQAWDARRRGPRAVHREFCWTLLHATLRRVGGVLPSEPMMRPARVASDLELLARHVGTTHAANISAMQLADAQVRFAACETALQNLRDNIATLKKAVRLDLAHSARPSDLGTHPKLRARLERVVSAQARLQGMPPDLLTDTLPQRAVTHDCAARVSGDAGTANTPVSTSLL